MDPATAIWLENVTYAYEQGSRSVIDGLSLRVRTGEWVTVCGASGSGKSALAGLLSGYLPRSGGGHREGRIEVDGLDPATAAIADLASRIGLVFQDPDAQLVQGLVEDEAAFGPENLCLPPDVIRRRVDEALRDVELLERRRDKVHELSGGGRQRAAIASVLALEPPILVLDEAAANLDAGGRRRLLALLRRLHQAGRTLVTVTGRLDELALAAPRLVVLDAGRVVLDGPVEPLLREHRGRLARLGLLPAETRVSAAAAPAAAALRAARADASPPLLEIRGLSFAYGEGKRAARRRSGALPAGPCALRDVSMRICPGEWHILRGENGSGKTTLSRLILGLLPAPAGAVFWQGRDASRLSVYDLAAEIGYVFQHPEQQFVAAKVLDELLFGPRRALRLRAKEPTPEPLLRQAAELLRQIGLAGRESESPYVLSGGEKRLLSAAAGLMSGKRLIVLDEPTAGTDYAGARLLSRLCREAVAQGKSILMITHEPEFFAGEPTRIWTMEKGRLREY
ncbi:ATP-binding cassette domain-containing protein [Paenibacillus faecis]|uniref:ATP-binding cassette domain-containing protein n=1 Tax=Paenibacillus faecis TaxID=862114 RepID=A0A5D0CPB7_9BACL|nr:ATP-binding cassette domain-containing protein [Paenibacillus faecis]TYA11658.1 ATP-binding cassette domain-containing protein [Paenibacillus faecis]